MNITTHIFPDFQKRLQIFSSITNGRLHRILNKSHFVLKYYKLHKKCTVISSALFCVAEILKAKSAFQLRLPFW